jgi:hypothetical protein
MENGKPVVSKVEPWKTRRLARKLSLLSIWLVASGCGSNSSPTSSDSFTDRQQAALKDPMSYKVPDNPGVSDGNTADFDKSGFQRDVNDVLNP